MYICIFTFLRDDFSSYVYVLSNVRRLLRHDSHATLKEKLLTQFELWKFTSELDPLHAMKAYETVLQMGVRSEVQAPGGFASRGISPGTQGIGGRVHSTDSLDTLGRRLHDINLRKGIWTRNHPL